MSTIHSFVQKDCNQIPWAGSIEEKVKLTTLKLHGKKEIVKVHTQRVENLPYTKLIMKERIKVGGSLSNGKSKTKRDACSTAVIIVVLCM